MAAEKNFENRLRTWLHSMGIYQAGMPEDKQTGKAAGWYLKVWGGGYQKSGIPDLLMCVNGIFLAVELKSSVGKPTDLQRKNIEMVNRGGGIGLVVYPEGFEQFKEIIKGVMMCDNCKILQIRDSIKSKYCDTLENCRWVTQTEQNKNKRERG